mmetsp:Transcript_29472/g.86125  ORF Transcript_29472/g.86125 Transcript_29472/m.86125 type:complete len:202 (-) Transcript_29472:19-624(-)
MTHSGGTHGTPRLRADSTSGWSAAAPGGTIATVTICSVGGSDLPATAVLAPPARSMLASVVTGGDLRSAATRPLTPSKQRRRCDSLSVRWWRGAPIHSVPTPSGAAPSSCHSCGASSAGWKLSASVASSHEGRSSQRPAASAHSSFSDRLSVTTSRCVQRLSKFAPATNAPPSRRHASRQRCACESSPPTSCSTSGRWSPR